jgi:hypothetical protein
MAARLEFCDICQYIKLEDYFTQARYPGTVKLGCFQDIAKKDRCPLCRLVIQSLNHHSQKHWEAGMYPVEVCYLGRYNRKSNWPVLEVWFNSTSETLPQGMWGHCTTLSQIYSLRQSLVHSNVQNMSKAKEEGSYQLIGEKVDVSRIQSWLQNCSLLHGRRCNPSKLHISKTSDLRLLLIDVKGMRLVECDWGVRYIALSYVWGSSRGLKSIKANIDHLKKEGALQEMRSELTNIVCGAINLIKAVGELYLWVDALCIVQDDNQSKTAYISRMNEIYGNAHATLIVLDENSADSALAGVTCSRSVTQLPIEINGLHLATRLPQLSDVVQKSQWSRRAWTFQEGYFSRRSLYISKEQVYWQCRSAYQTEDYPDDYGHDTSDSIHGRILQCLDREIWNDLSRQFGFYQSLVKQYSPRMLTYPSDSLLAFAGILSSMTNTFGWKFVSALPESLFDLALLWRPISGASMRPRIKSHSSADATVCKSPTWCWTAYHGNIFWNSWRLHSFAGQMVDIRTEVADFWIQDFSGLRQIQRRQTIDYDIEAIDITVRKQTTVDSVLIFQANTIDIAVYQILAPQIDLSDLGSSEMSVKGFSYYFRNNISHSLWIYDAAGRHCGTFPGLSLDLLSVQTKESYRHDLVLLSHSVQDEVTETAIKHYKDHLPLEYPSHREYYEEIFDTSCYKFKPNWALNIMLVRWDNGLAERVAVGQMHADAWKEAVQVSRLIKLV